MRAWTAVRGATRGNRLAGATPAPDCMSGGQGARQENPMTEYDSPTRAPAESPVLVLIGAAAGGAAGYALFWYARQWGFYAIVLPGALLGIGAGLARNRSVAMALICGLLALGLGLFTE